MMKAGILTLHGGYNEGANLQAFCLANFIKEQLQIETEIIDHRYPRKVKVYGKPSSPQQSSVDKFWRNKLPLSQWNQIDDNEQPVFEKMKDYSVVIAGSDELWKFSPNPVCPWHPPVPNVYWLSPSLKMPKIAYAASCGNSNYKSLPDSTLSKLKERLEAFDLLSVRDTNTKNMVSHLSSELGARTELVPDPTFAFDFSQGIDKEAFKAKLVKLGVDFSKKRILLTDFMLPPRVDMLRKEGWQVIHLNRTGPGIDLAIWKTGFEPPEWGVLLGMMDMVMCCRMHPAIMCLLAGVPFYILGAQSKSIDLCRSFGLSNNTYSGTFDPHAILANWPHDKVVEVRNEFKNRSIAYAAKMRNHLLSPSV